MAEAYAICSETKCKKPVYTKEEVDKKIDEQFYVIEGIVTVKSGTTETVTLNFPQGFTFDNCIIISAALYRLNIYKYGAFSPTVNGGNNPSIQFDVTFNSDNPVITSSDYKYRIILYRYK